MNFTHLIQGPLKGRYNQNSKLIVILGPTATGKTKLAAQLAFHFNGEIISADSRQVYRGMDIGTGKDLDDYNVNNYLVNYHLIDIIDPHEEFNLFLFKKHFNELFNKIIRMNKIPFLVGGTGLYISSILQNYELNKVDFNEDRFKELSLAELPELQLMLRALRPNLHNTTDLLDKERLIKAILVSEEVKDTPDEIVVIDSLVIGVLPPRYN